MQRWRDSSGKLTGLVWQVHALPPAAIFALFDDCDLAVGNIACECGRLIKIFVQIRWNTHSLIRNQRRLEASQLLLIRRDCISFSNAYKLIGYICVLQFLIINGPSISYLFLQVLRTRTNNRSSTYGLKFFLLINVIFYTVVWWQICHADRTVVLWERHLQLRPSFLHFLCLTILVQFTLVQDAQLALSDVLLPQTWLKSLRELTS